MQSSAPAAFAGQRFIRQGGATRRGATTLVRAVVAEPDKKAGYLQRKKEQEAKVFTRKPLKDLKSPTPSDIEIAQVGTWGGTGEAQPRGLTSSTYNSSHSLARSKI